MFRVFTVKNSIKSSVNTKLIAEGMVHKRKFFPPKHFSNNKKPLLVPNPPTNDFSSTGNMLNQFKGNLRAGNNISFVLAGIGVFLAYLYQMYDQNVQKPVISKSVLRNELYKNKKVDVIDAMTLKSAGHKVTVGRSRGHKVRRIDEEGQDEYGYYKEPFNRTGLLNELVIGALGRLLLGDKFPTVLAVETPLNDIDDDSRYGIYSQSLGGTFRNDNLENWAQLYDVDEEEIKFGPKHLGEAIAFDMIVGTSDTKLANVILIRDGINGDCYPIDHESSLEMPPQILTNADAGLKFIGEFRGKTLTERALEEQTNNEIDTQDNIHQPLKSNKAIKDKIAPVLLKAIDVDIQNKSVMQFYQRFVNLSEETLRTQVFDRFGSLMTEKEKISYVTKIQQRQAVAKDFLAKQQNSFVSEVTVKSTLSFRK